MLVLIAIALPGLARGQSRCAGLEVSAVIPVHPGIPTILQFPDAIEYAQVQHKGEFRIAGAGNELAVRPLPDSPAGMERLLEVKTRTMYRMFRLRVVARAEDAMRKVDIPAAEVLARTEAPRAALPAAPATPEPAASAPAGLPVTDDTGHVSPPEPARTVTGSPRFDLTVQAVVALGYTALDITGYEPITGRQAHRALGLRLTGAPHGAWWSVQADVSAEWAAGPMEYRKKLGAEGLAVNGPWLRAEIGVRARMGVTWIPTAYVGLGMQTHVRRSEKTNQFGLQATDTLKDSAVLALGMGFHRRVGDVLLGVDFQIRRGAPDGYRSVAALWTVGYFLDRGEEP